MSRLIYMVDDEEDLLWSTRQQMARERPEEAFETFADPVEALRKIELHPPDLLVTDLRMPKLGGLELIIAARRSAPQLPVVVITAYGSPEILEELRRRGSVEYLEKPFSFQAFAAAIDRALSAAEGGFSGPISLPMLPDIVQIYTLSRTTGSLQVSRGRERGRIWFAEGAIVHAEVGDLTGAEAFYRLLRWKGGRFALENGAKATVRTIDSQWQELLLEGCRRLDEEARQAAEEAQPGAPQAPENESSEPPPWVAETLATLGWPPAERMRHSNPGALVLAFDLDRGEARVVQGRAEAHPWATAVAGLGSEVARLAGGAPAARLEMLGEGAALVVAWNDGATRALTLLEGIAARADAARLRFTVARWNASSRGN